MNKYAQALAHLNNELEEQQVRWADMSEEAQDFFLAEWMLSGYENGLGRAEYGWALSAVQKVFPRLRLKVAWKVYDVWGVLQPPHQAPAAPPELLQAMINVALLLNKPFVSCLMVLCYAGLLRVREGLNLHCSDLVFLPDSIVVCLGQTKRGLEQKVVLANASVVAFLREYSRRFTDADPTSWYIPMAYGTALRWVKKLAELLGAAGLNLTTHTFRRSGASELAKQGMALNDILLYGRWCSERSAREYIRKGEVAVHRARAQLNPEVWTRITRWAQLGPQCWVLYDALHKQQALELNMDRITSDKFIQFEGLIFQMLS